MEYTNVAGQTMARPEMIPDQPHWDMPFERKRELVELVFRPTVSTRRFRWPSDPPDSPRLTRWQMLTRALDLTYRKRRGREAYYLDDFPNVPDIDMEDELDFAHIQDPVLWFLYNHMVVPIRQRQWDQAHGQHMTHLPKRIDAMKRKREELLQRSDDASRTASRLYDEDMDEFSLGGF